MMRILVPMDFTEVAMNALSYALAKYPDEDIEVVHVGNHQLSSNGKDQLKVELTDMIESHLNGSFSLKNIKVHVLEGQVISEIEKWLNDNDDVLQVVMGTRDKYDFFDRWVGTISFGLVKSLNIPIILVPRFASYNTYKKVLVASDYHPENAQVIDFLKKWNNQYNAFIKFLHIKTGDTDREIERKDQIISTLFSSGEPSFGFEISVLKHKDITQSLLTEAYNYNADVLVVIPENQSFIHALLFQSLSKELIMKSAIPILFIHKGDQQ